MYVKFTSKVPFAIKIFAGGVNTITGKANHETISEMPDLSLGCNHYGRPKQDYAVAPNQPWIHSLIKAKVTTHQFLAHRVGSQAGYVAQVGHTDAVVCMQFEITPRKNIPGVVYIGVETLSGKRIETDAYLSHTVFELEAKIARIATKEGIETKQQCLYLRGQKLAEECTCFICRLLVDLWASWC